MKKTLLVKTRWEYYFSNIVAFVCLIAVIIWSLSSSINNQGVDLHYPLFWLAVVCVLIIPFSIISFFSSMNTVEVNQKELSISYKFQKHVITIAFSDIANVNLKRTKSAPLPLLGLLFEKFTLNLKDGRSFDFPRSQFDQYDQLKSFIIAKVKHKN